VGYLWFKEIPSSNIWISAGIIVCVTAWSTYSEHISAKKRIKDTAS
jgi:drug/metabolite transporter (DMT)-like permease